MLVIPVSQPLLNGREQELLAECIKSGQISSHGPFVGEFECRFASYIGVDHGIAVSSGTAALETALFAAEIGQGDEVIMPSFTIISCALAAIRLGAVPVLVDAELETWNMDVTQIESRITLKTKAIMPVHIYGQPVDMGPLLKIAQRHNLIVVEDVAEAHGAEYKGRKCGCLGHISAFSFYANKIIATGEGGMVLTSNPKMAERARSYRNLCFHAQRKFFHTELGHNYRMTNLQAALGVAQTERIEEFIQIKRRLGKYYQEKLGSLEGIKCRIEKPWAKSVYWMNGIELDNSLGLSAEQMITSLAQKGIESRPFFLGLHEQPALHKLRLFRNEHYPVTERIARQGLYLPSGLTLTQAQIDYVVSSLSSIINARGCLREG